ncbi:c-type cytochrome [Hoeflea sp. TYP-13]|uniref:c-type cytochrome n=1 Tax=Hoeflea sp. TYP-13 TaxID=3230023 RepID=UPI0034C64054
MRKHILLTVTGIAVIAFGFAVSALLADRETSFMLKPDEAGIVAQGRLIYTQNCATCHGENLEGQPNWKSPGPNGRLPAPPHDETGHTWHHTDEILFGLTKYGAAKFAGIENYETDMPVYENVLSDQEIVAVLSYIKAQWPKEIRKRHDRMNSQAAN